MASARRWADDDDEAVSRAHTEELRSLRPRPRAPPGPPPARGRPPMTMEDGTCWWLHMMRLRNGTDIESRQALPSDGGGDSKRAPP